MHEIILEDPSDSEQRIDKFLKKYFKNASLWVLYKWLRTGTIKVNRKKVEQTYRLETWDHIEVYLTDREITELRKTEQIISIPREKKLEILFEDEAFLAINKTAWMNVHPWDHKSDEVSLIECVHDYLWKAYDSLSFRPSLVHRIDRDTSGIILIAKEKRSLETLLSDLQNRKIEKTYHAIVVGKPIKPRDTLSFHLERREQAKDEAKVIINPDGQEAITHYRTLRENIHGKYTLLECQIETGRTHQIRVHLAHIGIPILGDKAYGARGENSFARKNYGIVRQLLHARSLILFHPKTRKKIQLIAPYQQDFEEMLYQNQEYSIRQE